jgi:sec-independent protein translocase protein TatC
MFDELFQLRNIIVRSTFVLFLLLIVFFGVSFQSNQFLGVHIYVPSDNGLSIADSALEKIRADLTPPGTQLVTSSPLDPFTIKVTLAFVLALAVALPYILFELFIFIAPALYPKERLSLLIIMLSSLVLCFLGAIFAYKILIPFVFKALFTTLPANISALYNVKELITLVIGMMIAMAIVFLLPVVMILCTLSGLVPHTFWRSYARHAILLVFILSAIITPDGSGVSMALSAIPICCLYGVGYLGSRLVSKRKVTPS